LITRAPTRVSGAAGDRSSPANEATLATGGPLLSGYLADVVSRPA